MPDAKLTLTEWRARVGPLPGLLNMLAYDLYCDGRAPANALAEAVATLDAIHITGRTQNGNPIAHRTRRVCREAVQEFRAQVEQAEAKDSLAEASAPEMVDDALLATLDGDAGRLTGEFRSGR